MYITLALFFVPGLPPRRFSRSKCHQQWNKERIPLDILEGLLHTTPSVDQARAHSEYYTSGPHLGGQNLSMAIWTKNKWEEYGIPDVEIVTYEIYTNYPKSHRLGLLKATVNNSSIAKREVIDGKSYELIYEAGLTEEVLDEDPTTGHEDRIPTFHGYSARYHTPVPLSYRRPSNSGSGNVTAGYVYGGYCNYQDFEDLTAAGVNVSGKIVLCKYGDVFRGLKVKRAQELDAVGVLIYSDPGDDGEITELNGYAAYPSGPARNKNSVQRGSVQFLSYGPGDPTTPGYPSLPGVPRQDPKNFTPSIPSLPISYADALPLLKALNNHGINSSTLGPHWQTGGLYHLGVTYHVGPAPGISLNLVNDVEYVITPQWDVIGKIPGYITDETIILGNHRDAWIVGGAGDPNSGSAALNELARSFGKMIEIGWKPSRALILASWDGEEYGLLGSTEWVEDHQKELRENALAYINVDVGTTNPHFAATANPLLHSVIEAATKKVIDPNSKSGKTVYEVWDKNIQILGSGSDFTAFQDFLGIPSLDIGFSGSSKDSPIYHYHSNYDSFHWMEKYGDPGFEYHVAIAKIWGFIALELSESPVVRFNATNYAVALGKYLKKIEKSLPAEEADEHPPHHGPHGPPGPHDPDHDHPPPPHHGPPKDGPHPPFHCPTNHTHPHHRHHRCQHRPANPHALRYHLHRLSAVISNFQELTTSFDARAAELSALLSGPPPPWYKRWQRVLQWLEARRINQAYKRLDRAFVYPAGLDGREWFKHVVYAPGKWSVGVSWGGFF